MTRAFSSNISTSIRRKLKDANFPIGRQDQERNLLKLAIEMGVTTEDEMRQKGENTSLKRLISTGKRRERERLAKLARVIDGSKKLRAGKSNDDASSSRSKKSNHASLLGVEKIAMKSTKAKSKKKGTGLRSREPVVLQQQSSTPTHGSQAAVAGPHIVDHASLPLQTQHSPSVQSVDGAHYTSSSNDDTTHYRSSSFDNHWANMQDYVHIPLPDSPQFGLHDNEDLREAMEGYVV